MPNYDNLPEEYQPAWYRLKLKPLNADSQMTKDDIKNQMKKHENLFIKKSAPVIILNEEEDIPKIVEAKVMQSADASMWYEELDGKVDESSIVDNNDVVDLEKIQTQPSKSIVSIRQKLLEEKKIKEKAESKTMFVAPGEYVLLHKKQIVEVGVLSKIKPLAVEIIINSENISDDDLVIFLRVPLDKIFR